MRLMSFELKNDLSFFFEPESVAVIGSLRENFFGGYVTVKSLLKADLKGRIYPINPSNKEVLGLKVYPSITEVPRTIDLVLIIIGCQSVPDVLRECAQKGVKAVIVVSDGFAERDEKGASLQKEIAAIANEAGMRIIGPNTAGIANSKTGLSTSPYTAGYDQIKAGGIAICAQTGMVNPQAFPYLDLHYGVSKICDLGNKCDVDECDMLEYFGSDPATRVISMYLESIRDGRRFLEVSKRTTAAKPVLILKSGRTKEGARVSASHTGSLAANDQIFTSACQQAGILRLEKFSELFELPKIFASQPLPRGNRMGIVSYTGAVGVLATDEGIKYGLSVPPLSPKTASKLNSIFAGLGKTIVDIGPLMVVARDYTSIYQEILNAVLEDENIDCLFNVLWTGPVEGLIEIYLGIYKELQKNSPKPIATWIYGPRSAVISSLSGGLEDLGFPVFSDLEMAVKALGMAYQYSIKGKGEKGWSSFR
jgi:acyl-CoA synthetase (NDP forming)